MPQAHLCLRSLDNAQHAVTWDSPDGVEQWNQGICVGPFQLAVLYSVFYSCLNFRCKKRIEC